jgi:hypothetical protein
MVYSDINNSDSMVARLKRRTFGFNNPTFAAPLTMATVQSAAGTSDTTRRAITTAIAQPVINKNAAFYYVEVDIPTFNLRLLGVQIDVRPTCP